MPLVAEPTVWIALVGRSTPPADMIFLGEVENVAAASREPAGAAAAGRRAVSPAGGHRHQANTRSPYLASTPRPRESSPLRNRFRLIACCLRTTRVNLWALGKRSLQSALAHAFDQGFLEPLALVRQARRQDRREGRRCHRAQGEASGTGGYTSRDLVAWFPYPGRIVARHPTPGSWTEQLRSYSSSYSGPPIAFA
jgi:hypothetical protein